jgi:hypothetical protein
MNMRLITLAELKKLEQTLPIEPDNNVIHEAVEFYWGERCPEHEDGCPICTAWKLYDKLIGAMT